jgi:serine/threonine protein kinase/tetratricopeptide (TPR) repeat protein
VGTSIARYIVVRHLGAGGMGQVFVAYDPVMERQVAIKIQRCLAGAEDGAQAAVETAIGEARSLAQLVHPNIVSVYDIGIHADFVYFAMELVEGSTFNQWLKNRRDKNRIGWREVLHLMLAAGQGIAAAHARGLLHRDIKPDNIFVGRDGSVKIGDFGLSIASERREERSKISLKELIDSQDLSNHPELGAGTPGYMSPEQYRNCALGVQSDVFSFCATIFVGLFGTLPFGRDPDLAFEKCRLAAIAWPDKRASGFVPRWVREVLARGLAFEPDERFHDLPALLAAIEEGLSRPSLRKIVLNAALPVMVAGMTLGLTSAERAETRCAQGGAFFSGMWDDDVSNRFIEKLQSSSIDDMAQREKLADQIDAYRDEWVATYGSVCQNSQSKKIAAVNGDAQINCLHRARATFVGFIESLQEINAIDEKNAADLRHAFSRLPAISRCLDDSGIDATLPLDEEERRVILELRNQVASLSGRYLSGARHELQVDVEHVLQRAYQLDDATALARSHELMGAIASDFFDAARARFHFERASLWNTAANQSAGIVEATVGRIDAQVYHGRDVEVSEELTRTMWSQMAAIPEPAPLLMRAFSAEGLVHWISSRHRQSLNSYRWAYEAALRSHGLNNIETLRLMNNVSVALERNGENAQAVAFQKRVVALSVDVLGANHPKLIKYRENLALFYALADRHEEARDESMVALESCREIYASHPIRCVSILATLAQSYNSLGMKLASRDYLLEASEIQFAARDLGLVSENIAYSLAARRVADLGEATKAWQMLEARRPEEIFGEQCLHECQLNALISRVETLHALGDFARAKSMLEKSAAAESMHVGPDSEPWPDYCQIQFEVDLALGHFDKAKEWLDRLIALQPKTEVEENAASAWVLLKRARFVAAQNNFRAALVDANRGLVAWMAAVGPKHRTLAPYLFEIGRIFAALGETEQAEMNFKSVIEQIDEPEDAWTLIVPTYTELGKIYESRLEFERAESAYLHALEPENLDHWVIVVAQREARRGALRTASRRPVHQALAKEMKLR